MKTRLLLNLGLLAVLLASCAPSATPAQFSTAQAIPLVEPSGTPILSEPTNPSGEPTLEPSIPTPLSIATSRGPNLEATDPAAVNLASGSLQFVEFFRFT